MQNDAATDIDAAQDCATAREIAQQPVMWRAVHATVQTRRNEIDAFLQPLLARDGLRIIFSGAGTSAFAGRMLAAMLQPYYDNVTVEAQATTDIVARPKASFTPAGPVLLVSFARSGNSPESVAAARLAEQCAAECYHLVLTCNDDGQLYRNYADAEHALVLTMPPQTNDAGFAMTSSVSTMMWAALSVFMPQAATTQRLQQAAVAAERVLADDASAIKQLAHGGHERIVYLGSGALNGLAQEAALKMLELTAGEVLAYHDTPLGFRHGPKALITTRTLTIVFVSNDDYARRYDEDIVNELVTQCGGDAVVAANAQDSDALAQATSWHDTELADVPDWLLVFPYLVRAQLLALHTSIAHGKRVDNPFPGGDVNRVVQGVTIHPFAGPAT